VRRSARPILAGRVRITSSETLAYLLDSAPGRDRSRVTAGWEDRRAPVSDPDIERDYQRTEWRFSAAMTQWGFAGKPPSGAVFEEMWTAQSEYMRSVPTLRGLGPAERSMSMSM